MITGDKVPEYDVVACYGPVIVPCVGAGNFVRDWIARFTDFFGGWSKSYEAIYERLITRGLDSMAEQAKSSGANAILNLRLESADVSGNSIIGLLLYGTAVKIEKTVKIEHKEAV
jgi:uncharacterized protein YbjQ (UPF0145 family)